MSRWLALCTIGIGLTLSAQTYELDSARERSSHAKALTETLKNGNIYMALGKQNEILFVIKRPGMWYGSDTELWLIKNRIEWKLLGFKQVQFGNMAKPDWKPKDRIMEVESPEGGKLCVLLYRTEVL